MILMDTISLYYHIPFCRHRCAYCDFNTYVKLEYLFDKYVQALCTEFTNNVNEVNERPKIKTIYFGGGTPTLLSTQHFQTILANAHEHTTIPVDTEITIEANPGITSFTYLKNLRQLGINRISFGVQSANPKELQLLDRQHTYTDVIQSVYYARKAGFENINLDLIFGIPDQTLIDWQRSLKLAQDLNPEHFSLYELSIERGTPLCKYYSKGLFSPPDQDLAASKYEWASEFLSKNNYTQYEISNWARSDTDDQKPNSRTWLCKHNLQYWHNLEYLGIGAGAHSFANDKRTVNYLSPIKYIKSLHEPPSRIKNVGFPNTRATEIVNEINRETEIGETMMMGLRLTQIGVSKKIFQDRFDQSMEEIYGKKINHFIRLGLLEWAGKNQDILRLTTKGRLLGNQVFMEFI